MGQVPLNACFLDGLWRGDVHVVVWNGGSQEAVDGDRASYYAAEASFLPDAVEEGCHALCESVGRVRMWSNKEAGLRFPT
jgi:hypothetical protein